MGVALLDRGRAAASTEGDTLVSDGHGSSSAEHDNDGGEKGGGAASGTTGHEYSSVTIGLDWLSERS
jgi:hypothetical protein